eukprot:8360874-Pyramimonas_sp.AAC.1
MTGSAFSERQGGGSFLGLLHMVRWVADFAGRPGCLGVPGVTGCPGVPKGAQGCPEVPGSPIAL